MGMLAKDKCIKNTLHALATVIVFLICISGFENKVLADDSDIVYIPDEYLKWYINEALGVEDAEADITEGQMKDVTELNLWQVEDRVSDLTGIKYCTNLTSLELALCTKITDFSEIGELTDLTVLNLRGTKITDFSILKNLTKLTSLELDDTAITDLAVLEHLTDLTSLGLSDCDRITDISKLGGLTKLTYLDLSYCNELRKLSGIETLINLDTLRLEESESLTDLSGIGNLTKLTYLYMARCRYVSDISEFEKLTDLKTLYLTECYNIKDISALGNLTNLLDLNLSHCSRVIDISALGKLKNLTKLSLHSCYNITDLSILGNLTTLTSLDIGYIRREGKYTEAEKQAISSLINLEYLYIYGNNLYNKDTVIFDDLTKLKRLNLTSNHITDFSFVSKLPNLIMSSSSDSLGETYANYKEYLPEGTLTYAIKNDVKDENGNYVAPTTSTVYDYDEETNEIIFYLNKFTNSTTFVKYDFKATTSKGEKVRILHRKTVELKYLYELKGTLESNRDVNDYEVGEGITLKVTATGGKEDYMYKFAVLNVDTGMWYVLRDFSKSNIYTYYFDYPGTKQFAVTVKDSEGNTVATNRLTANVYEILSAKLTVDGSTNALTKVKGSKITLEPVVTRGNGEYTYRYAVLNVDTGKWSVLKDFSETSTYTYALNYPGKKQFAVTVQDSDGNTVGTNRITVDVYEKMSAKLTVDGSTKDLTKAKGSKITLTPVVSGGTGGYTYKYAVLNVDTGKWSVLKDFSDTKTYTYSLDYPGKKQFALTVKDSKGNTVATNRINVTVK